MKKGFTLAEILLALSVIGIISALTIPTLIQKSNNEQMVTKLKKEYSILQQAFVSLQNDNGGNIVGNIYVGTNYETPLNAFASKLNIIKNCGTASNQGCWYNTGYYLLGVTTSNPETDGSAKGILADGTLISLNNLGGDCNANIGYIPNNPAFNSKGCGDVTLDINGKTGPNTYGRDIFMFRVFEMGVYPVGIFKTSISDCSSSGYGSDCAYKVLSEGAINY